MSESVSCRLSRMPGMTLNRAQRTPLIVAAVLVLHALGLWAFQSGLIHRAIEVMVPSELIAELTQPEPIKPPPSPPALPATPKQAVPKMSAPVSVPVPAPAVLPAAAPTLTPAPAEPVSTAAPTANSPVVAAPAGPVAAQAPAVVLAPPAPPAPAKVELPSSDAQYLQNPKPSYPVLSKRMGEQGKVVVHVLIGTDGLPQKAEIKQSSGFDRLDKAALATVLSWKYVPGKRGGVPEAMWFNVPINFVLE